jgi:predicted CoA-binding protein
VIRSGGDDDRIERRLFGPAEITVPDASPGHSSLLDRPCYPRVSAIPEPVDLVDVFRRSELVAPVIDDPIAAHARAIWLQDGIMRDHLTLLD